MRLPKLARIGLVVAVILGGAAFLVGPKPDETSVTSTDVIADSNAETIEVLDPVHG